MENYQREIQLEAIRSSGPPMDAFIKSDIFINPRGYEIHPTLLDLLQSKMFAGDDTEDPYGHIEYFEDVCATFNLNIFSEDEVKFKLFRQTLTDKARTLYNDYPILHFFLNEEHYLLNSSRHFFQKPTLQEQGG
jgi:hypothetical protein